MKRAQHEPGSPATRFPSISSPSRGKRAENIWRACAPLLTPLSWPYAAAVVARRAWWRSRARSLDCPVVSVGNLTCGGTGKTPTVEMLVRELRELRWNPAVLSRGYGAPAARSGRGGGSAEASSDEYRVLAANLPDVPHFQGADRLRNGRRAIEEGADLLVLDDGFQHVRLRRDLDLVLIDALDPFGSGRLLPAGTLREPLSALRHADLLGITRADLERPERVESLSESLSRLFPGLPQLRLGSRALGWRGLDGTDYAADAFRGQRVLAFCGIGNPEAFRLQLGGLGVVVERWFSFSDHHPYSAADVATIAAGARSLRGAAVLMTQKDAVKLEDPEFRAAMGDRPWAYLRIEQTVTEGEERLRNALLGLGHPRAR